MPELQEVFLTGGMPQYTFVKPKEYRSLILALKTPGKGIVIEGPSGIGKTTAVLKAIKEIGIDEDVLQLSARNQKDVELIEHLDSSQAFGIVIVDDFHRLNDIQQKKLADLLKYLADIRDKERKLIIIGINQVGQELIQFGIDLATRIEILEFEKNPDDKIEELINKGEQALNVKILCKKEIIKAARGSFYITQELCLRACLLSSISSSEATPQNVSISGEEVITAVFKIMHNKFHTIIEKFAIGTRFRREGRAPYFHILKWFGEERLFELNLPQMMNKHPEQKAGVTQVFTKGYLANLISSSNEYKNLFFLTGDLLIIQDPQLLFYLSNINWDELRTKLGYLPFEEEKDYDYALSFAGENRDIAEAIKSALLENEISVFYDNDHASEILAEDVEKYLEPIYASRAQYIICILSEKYPRKVWTVFESQKYKNKIAHSEVIPIVIPPFQLNTTDPLFTRGRIDFSTSCPRSEEINRIVVCWLL